MPSTSATGAAFGLQHRIAEGADLLGHACQATDGMSHYFDESPGAPSAEATVDRRAARHRRSRCAPTAACSATAGSTPGTALLLRAAPRAAAAGRRCSTSAAAPGPIALTLARRAPARDGVGGRRQRAGPRAVRRQRRRPTASPTSRSPRPTTCPADVALRRRSGRTRRSASASPRCTTLLTHVARPAGARRPGRARRAEAPRRRLAAALARPTQGWPTTRLASAKGYRLLQVRATTSCDLPGLVAT